jgi:uncharacterized protein
MPFREGDLMDRNRRSTVRRLPERASYDRATIEAIVDEGAVAHVGFVSGGTPVVIPMTYGRDGATLFIHGSAASRLMKELSAGIEVCFEVTHLDGLVLARSAFHHSMNYRSVVVFGKARPVDDPSEKLHALRVISDHVVPGRWSSVRPPNELELRATLVLALPLDEASAKIRSGPPGDDESDIDPGVWAGEIPLRLTALAPVADAVTAVAPPSHVEALVASRR